MSYTPTEWQPDDIVTAARMNSLETAVGEMNMSYTPNTWVNGDVITAAKMNALEQAVASGGGSSDFSTAEVTLILGGEMYEASLVGLPHIDSNSLKDVDLITGDESERIVFSVPLYKGVLVTLCAGGVYADNVTGGIVMDSETGILTITGDGTITINASW